MTKERREGAWNSMRRSFGHKFKINRVEEGENCVVLTSTHVAHFFTYSMMKPRSGQFPEVRSFTFVVRSIQRIQEDILPIDGADGVLSWPSFFKFRS